MPTLWFKFPDETPLYARFRTEEKARLENIFSATDEKSPWNKALLLLRLTRTPEPLVCWHHGTPYFNWSAMVQVISGGAVHALQKENNSYVLAVDYSPRKLWALLACQWKVVRFLQRPPSGDRLAESIALGLALQSLLMRLGREEKHLPGWLAVPASAPKKFRRTVEQIQKVQMRRTHLSPAWHELFPPRPDEGAQQQPLPDYFWDVPQNTAAKTTAAASGTGPWTGKSVCGGQVTGMAVLDASPDICAALSKTYNAPLILVFRRARPETTELFEHASALLFAEGGILSHACTVARERNIPAVTGLGTDFFDALQNHKMAWLAIDGGAGTVKMIQSPKENMPSAVQ